MNVIQCLEKNETQYNNKKIKFDFAQDRTGDVLRVKQMP